MIISRSTPRGVRVPSRAWDRGHSPRTAVIAAVLAVAAWIVAPGVVPPVHVPPAHRGAAQPGLPWLSAHAGRICDPQGSTVLLRGFNTEALLEPTAGGPAPLDDADVARMAAEGFDSVRLPIVWSRLEPRRGYFDDGYLDLIARTVSMINARNMYVIIDMHFLDWGARYGGHGAPAWAHLDGIPDVRPWGEPWGRHLSPAQNADYTYFWTSPDWQRDFLRAWQFVARRFQDRSGVAGYDVYNEPHPLPVPPGAFERQALWPLYAHAISAIGHVDPNHVFIVEATLFGDWGTAVQPLHAANLVYSGHVYTGSLVPPAFTGDPAALVAHVDAQAAAAAQLGTPLWEGELGIDHTQPHAAQWADTALDHFDDLAVGWAWWQWRQDAPWGVVSRDGSHIDTAFLAHLARPYLISAPRDVTAGHGDGVGGRLTIHVAASLNGSVAVVAWPLGIGALPRVVTNCASVVVAPSRDGRISLALDAHRVCDATLTIQASPA